MARDEQVKSSGAAIDEVMQKLQAVMSSLVNTIQNVQVDKLTILPGTDGRSADAVRLVEELKASVDVDIPALLKSFASRGGSLPAPSE